MITVGIDPGKTGGIAIIAADGTLETHVMPDLGDFIVMMLTKVKCGVHLNTSHVFLEKAQAMPKNGAVSMFNYGAHYGQLIGVLKALAIRHTLIPPRTWSKELHLGTKFDATKKRSLEAVRRLFPEATLVPPGCKVPHIGIVDAILIAEYGRRHLANFGTDRSTASGA